MRANHYLSDAIQSAIIGVDQVARAMEMKWGVGRLVCLVSDDTRLRFKRACALFDKTISENDGVQMPRVAAMMKRAWEKLDAEAVQSGCAPMAPTVWETRLDDGRVLCVVRTAAEAAAVAAEGRELQVWTLEEVGRILGAQGVLSDIKNAFPGARVENVIKRSETFAHDWATSDDLLPMVHENELMVPA